MLLWLERAVLVLELFGTALNLRLTLVEFEAGVDGA
jgi:hypothetical protein